VRTRIEHALQAHEGRFAVVPLPNMTHVFYGRDVGYTVERIDLDADLQASRRPSSGVCSGRQWGAWTSRDRVGLGGPSFLA